MMMINEQPRLYTQSKISFFLIPIFLSYHPKISPQNVVILLVSSYLATVIYTELHIESFLHKSSHADGYSIYIYPQHYLI